MAILTQAWTADLIDRLGEVPANVTTAISALTAAQRDDFLRAWINSTDEQHQRAADQWVLREDDREDFQRFADHMNEGTV
jgi:hypothetical protein